MKPPAVAVAKLAQVLDGLGQVLAGLFILVMLLATVVDVGARLVFNAPFSGVVDVVEFTVMWSTMIGIALAWHHRQHIVVDILDIVLPRGVIRALDLVARLVAIVLCAWLARLAWPEYVDMADFGDRTMDARIPLAWFWLAALVGYGWSALFLLLSFFVPPPRPMAV